MSNYKLVYPEMGEKVPADTQIEFTTAYGGKLYLTTALELKGRGINMSGDGSGHKRGLENHHATERAMDKLKKEYICTYIAKL